VVGPSGSGKTHFICDLLSRKQVFILLEKYFGTPVSMRERLG
jgi:hypothetical protein